MRPKKEKEYYKQVGMMKLFKNDMLIREYKFHDVSNRRRILSIWNSEVKPNGIDKLELTIKLD